MKERVSSAMQRYTKKNGSDYFIESNDVCKTDTNLSGAPINQFAAYENFFEDLLLEKRLIAEQLEVLRQADKTKTVTFKQLFANKISIEIMIERIQRYQK